MCDAWNFFGSRTWIAHFTSSPSSCLALASARKWKKGTCFHNTRENTQNREILEGMWNLYEHVWTTLKRLPFLPQCLSFRRSKGKILLDERKFQKCMFDSFLLEYRFDCDFTDFSFISFFFLSLGIKLFSHFRGFPALVQFSGFQLFKCFSPSSIKCWLKMDFEGTAFLSFF